MRGKAWVAIAAFGFGSAAIASGTPAAPQRDFAVAAHPQTDDIGPGAIRHWPGGVTSVADVRYSVLPGWRRLTVDLYLPPRKGGPRPLVLYIHGGGWMNSDGRHFGALADFPAVAARLAREGFVVAALEYRMAGEAHFPAQVQDARAALRFLKGNAARYGIDPSRSAVIGGSAGAHLGALAAFSCGDARYDVPGSSAPAASECVQAFVGWYGVYDVAALMAAREGGRDGPLEKLLGCEGACPSERVLLASPIEQVDGRDPATLLIHGTADRQVPVSQSHALEARLKAAGVPVTAIYIAGVDHSFVGGTEGETRAATLRAVNASFDFLHQMLDGGRK